MKNFFLMLPLVFGLSFVACGDDEEIKDPQEEQTEENKNQEESEENKQEGTKEDKQETSPENGDQEGAEQETPGENDNQPNTPSSEELSQNQGVSVSGLVNGYTYVDLGLDNGVLWATYNVGAASPIEAGYYFAWGEVEPKEIYDHTTYKYYEKGKWTKYIRQTSTIMDYEYLQETDDAAIENWGKEWRMPTNREHSLLVKGCDWEWCENFNGTGVVGMLGTSKKNGNTIFLPDVGYMLGPDTGSPNALKTNEGGFYWSSQLGPDYTNHAYCLWFDSTTITASYLQRSIMVLSGRHKGYPVRAVTASK